MKDRFDVAIVLVIAVAVVGIPTIAALALANRTPWKVIGAPPSARCSHDDDGVRTCVADGIAYTCVTDWRERVIACGQRRPR